MTNKMPILIGLGILVILVGIFFTQFTIGYKSYSQDELEDIYYKCMDHDTKVANHYFFDKNAFSYGVRCFDWDNSMSYIYGDCDKIIEYEKVHPPFFKRLHKCSNSLEVNKR